MVSALPDLNLSSCFAELAVLKPEVLDEESYGENLRELLQYILSTHLQDQTFASTV
ncbi:MAG TPA: hypothetical protein VLF41_00075 [Candidatus Nanoarchaeia archaeon]|nr:hypothetical protein [Candidatus Nanoarchaeia archaeon]